MPKIQNIARRHAGFASTIRLHPVVRDVRTLGTMLAFGINTGKDGYLNTIATDLTKQALDYGIYLRPLGNTVYLLPPYCITEKEMDQVYSFLVHYLEKMLAIV